LLRHAFPQSKHDPVQSKADTAAVACVGLMQDMKNGHVGLPNTLLRALQHTHVGEHTLACPAATTMLSSVAPSYTQSQLQAFVVVTSKALYSITPSESIMHKSAKQTGSALFLPTPI
jgi:hypothetical protein